MQNSSVNAASSTLALLQHMYPGAVLLDTEQVAQAVGLSAKTVRNLGPRFAVPPVKIGGSCRFKIVDVAAVIDSGMVVQETDVTTAKRPRGRPRKVVARQEGGGV